MKITYQRLDKNHIPSLLQLSKADGFPCELTQELAELYCCGKPPADEGVQTYGVCEDNEPVSVMTATFCRVFPHKDSPGGRIVHISGAFTLPERRHRGCAAGLLRMIESDAAAFGADYICCDSTADGLYRSRGFEPAPEDETRMWKHVSDNNAGSQ